MKKLLGIALAIALVAAALVGGNAVAQKQIEDTPLSAASVATGYFNINSDGSVGAYALDSNSTDTSASYKIVPGSHCAVFAYLDAAADTVVGFFVDVSADGNHWAVLDTVGAVNGVATTYMQLANTAAVNIVGRYLRFRTVNDDGADAATSMVAHLVVGKP